jgi:hypothetical protein
LTSVVPGPVSTTSSDASTVVSAAVIDWRSSGVFCDGNNATSRMRATMTAIVGP